jgi:hypothetical protein
MTNILDEIKDLKNDPSHRSALRIFYLLDNNRTKFLEKFDADFIKNMISGFEGLAYESPANAASANFKEQYNKLHQAFEYQLNRL